MTKDKLTNKKYWSSAWQNITLPCYLDWNKYYDRVFIKLFKKYFHKNSGLKSVLEIGCAPGKYLAFLAKELGFVPTGIDYSPIGIKKTRKNLKILGVRAKLIQADFLTHSFSQKYDLVFSSGFIEHFKGRKLERIKEKHAQLVEPGGKLALFIPNLCHLNYYWMKIFNPEVLAGHNLEIMNFKFLRDFASQYGFKILYLNCLGGLSPASFKFPKEKPLSLENKLLFWFRNQLLKIRKFSFFDHFNSPLFSFYLGAIMQKENKKEIVLSYSSRHFTPGKNSDYGYTSAGQWAKHLYQLLSRLRKVYYHDNPVCSSPKLWVTINNWDRYCKIFPQKTLVFLPDIHFREKRKVLLMSDNKMRFSGSIDRLPSLALVKAYEIGLSQADHLIVVGNETVKKTFTSNGISSNRFTLVNTGIDFKHFLPRQRTGNQIRFVAPLSRFSLIKGLPYLIKAWRRFQGSSEASKAELILLGKPGDYVFKSSGLKNFHVFGEYICGSPKHLRWLNSSHYVVFPSLIEGQAGSLLEAMSCGCIPIATRQSGIDADKYSGWTIEAAKSDSLYERFISIVKNHKNSLWNKRSISVRNKVIAKHSWKDIDEKILSICRQYL